MAEGSNSGLRQMWGFRKGAVSPSPSTRGSGECCKTYDTAFSHNMLRNDVTYDTSDVLNEPKVLRSGQARHMGSPQAQKSGLAVVVAGPSSSFRLL